MPTFDADRHDISIDGKGYMRATAGDALVMRQDAVPHIARAALGEGRYDLFQIDSFFAQADWAGGAGQSRVSATDAYLSGVSDTRFSGFAFPARKKLTAASTGGTSRWLFSRGSSVYGFSGSNIELVGTSTTYAAGSLPVQQPDVDANNNVYWAAADGTLRKWTGSGSATSTGPGGVTVQNFRLYGQYGYCFGVETAYGTPTLVQSTTASGSTTLVAASLTNRPKPGNVLVAACFASTGSKTTPSGWTLIKSQGQLAVYGRTVESGTTPSLQVVNSVAATMRLHLAEFAGVDSDLVVDAVVGSSNAASTTVASGSTGTLPNSDALAYFAAASTGSTATATATNYTEISDTANLSTQYRALSSTSAQSPSVTATGSGDTDGICLVLKGNTLTSNTEQFCIYYTGDGGSTWTSAFTGGAMAIGPVIESAVGGGFLFFTTPRALYQMATDEEELISGEIVITIAIREVERFPKVHVDATPADWGGRYTTPSAMDFAGAWLAIWNGSVFYPVGQTLRRYAIGANGAEQVWPTAYWGTTGGDVKAVVAGEGGVWFGAGTTLWMFNGRGFHPLATDSTSGIYDYLYWHDGKLYLNGDPAKYYDFGYPALRPDIYSTAATNFETGYVVTSLIDLEKVDVDKVLRTFQTQAQFSAASDSGSITLAYLVADSAGNNPERLGGGATSLTWTTIHSHTVSDGNVKRTTISPHIKAKAIYLRATLTPGASGYPILRSVAAFGRTIMPRVTRFVVPLALGTGIRDKQGKVLYPTVADVQAAQDTLLALRSGSDPFTVKIVQADGTTDDYLCTFEKYDDALILQRHEGQAAGLVATAVLLEVP